jgi:hypothetical protein
VRALAFEPTVYANLVAGVRDDDGGGAAEVRAVLGSLLQSLNLPTRRVEKFAAAILTASALAVKAPDSKKRGLRNEMLY